jgi:hypothetical protein
MQALISAGSKAVKKSTVAKLAVRKEGHSIEVTCWIRGIAIPISLRTRDLSENPALATLWSLQLRVRKTINIGRHDMHLVFAQKLALCRHPPVAPLGDRLFDNP